MEHTQVWKAPLCALLVLLVLSAINQARVLASIVMPQLFQMQDQPIALLNLLASLVNVGMALHVSLVILDDTLQV